MKTTTAILAGLVAVAAIGFTIYMVDIEQTEEARLPDVDVTVEGGNMPEFQATTGSVSVDQEEVEVTVPKLRVTTEEETVTVPEINVTPPEDEDVAQND